MRFGRQIIEYDYQADGRNVRDFFPFFDYSNVLDVRRSKAVYGEETPFEEGLKRAFEWFMKNREEIVFYQHIEKNEQEILARLKERESS